MPNLPFVAGALLGLAAGAIILRLYTRLAAERLENRRLRAELAITRRQLAESTAYNGAARAAMEGALSDLMVYQRMKPAIRISGDTCVETIPVQGDFVLN